MKLTIKESAFKKAWDDKYQTVHLDHEIYYGGYENIPRSFFILTSKEIDLLNRKTQQRIKKFDRTKPKGWAGYE